ncbi:ATP-binding protein [Anabaena cylindrica UHCC 0172]|uniref:AAA family ATPase n=1 Tax=Anabaena cylindrica TaxID=1165 RepID=UPI002B1FEF25|nr:ATP-binding protein [Anabaena cylindrica]MEA5552587.1 ATP-binding protein [Anabaena cylindrica UHCC 0172]
MNEKSPVPRLDLAPKLRHPLSLWNPLDYLLLLYWVFYFPQALRWYVDTFGGGYIPEEQMNWSKGLEILRQNSVQRQLLFQGVVLTIITPILICFFLQELGLRVDWFGVAVGVAGGVAVGVAGGVAVLRPENWLFSLFNLPHLRNGSFLLPRITIIHLPYLNSRLKKWLLNDWNNGIHNVNQLLAYTMQFIPVVQTVNNVLNAKPPEQIIWSVSQLAETTYDWELIHFLSASLSEKLKSRSLDGVPYPFPGKRRLKASLNTDTRLDTPSHAAAAGFWYLYEKQPFKAIEAFKVVRSLLYGEEMYILALTLAVFSSRDDLNSIANIKIPTFPTTGLLRPVTWQTLDRFVKVIEDIKIINRSASRVSRSSALNRALGELTTILNTADTLLKAEQGLIIDITKNWQLQLLQIAGEVGEIVITKPVNNPYVIGDPVMGNLFIGREDIIRQLEELWLRGIQLQSVVIYGHRRMGKTSILLNAANSLGANVKVVYVNLLKLGDVTQGVGEVLMAISDEISQVVNIEPPNDDDLLKLPERTFNRYFEKVIKNLSGGLIIAIDEFEKIEDLIKAGKISPDFMGFLRSLVQAHSQVAFAFAGLHTLDEMTADYFQPFFASVLPIRVGFLSRGATGQILANPAIEDFLLDYTPEALDKIYGLTHGQPYLVQLVGFHLVRLYNDFVFEQGKPRESVFTVEDVEAIVNKPEFFQRGSNYFNGVWGQAEENGNIQQVILSHLAKHTAGLSLNELVEFTVINETDLQTALEVLKRHDVIVENQEQWRIIVELFRRWVVNMAILG